MRKYKVAIVSTGNPLESILAAIDLDNIEICAVFGFWDGMSPILQKTFLKVFQSLDMLPVNCVDCGADYFLVDFPGGDNWAIQSMLTSRGIDFKKILIMEIFGTKPQFAYSYQYQWNYIIKNKPNLDFIVTGISYVRDAFDLKAMEPWKGVNFSRDSQDLYYSYKMAETYLSNIPPPLS